MNAHKNTPRIGIVATGMANVEAVTSAVRRLGRETYRVETAAEVADASFIVVPGVGSFASGVDSLGQRGLVGPLRDRVAAGRPTLAICLGLHLLCEASDEAPGVRGLGSVPGRVSRFGANVRVPQVGWNRVGAPREARYLRSGVMYFANSYRLESAPEGWVCATSRHGGSFVAALERGGVLACQFHPELSGIAGHRLIRSWIELAPDAASAADGRSPGPGAALETARRGNGHARVPAAALEAVVGAAC